VTGFIALAYLSAWVVPLVTGRIEITATEVSIDRIEAEGFPDASYLKVTGGYLIVSEGDADVRLHHEQGELHDLTVPVVSKSQWDEWQTQLQRDEPIDASRLRLAVKFRGEQVAQLWPELKQLAENGSDLDLPPIQMTLIGETEPMKFLLSDPLQSRPRKDSLDLEAIRGMRFEKHYHSLGNLVKGLVIALGLLTFSIAVLVYHRKHPTRAPRPTLNIETLEDMVGPDIDLD
jgi:hypothetical protein